MRSTLVCGLVGVFLCVSIPASAGVSLPVDPPLPEPGRVVVDYPAAGTLFPPEFAAPTFLWHDRTPGVDAWRIRFVFTAEASPLEVTVAGDPPPPGEIDPECVSVTNEPYRPTPYQASARSFKPSDEFWRQIRDRARPAGVEMTVIGLAAADRDEELSRGSVRFATSVDPVGAPIFYRDVPLMPSATKDGTIKPLDQAAQPLIRWRLRDLALPASRVMLESMPTCANCHSFSADGSTMAMDVDGPDGDKGAYAIADLKPDVVIDDEQVMTWNAFPDKPRGFNTLGFLSRISPDGRHAVSTVNEALYVRNFWDYRFSQVFFPTRGILAWTSREAGNVEALPGADDPEYVHCDPVWTPDGKTLVFARATARDSYDPDRPAATYANDPNETEIRYDLYRMPFNDGKGGEPEPIAGAAANGKSNSFPKVSPDGRWVVYVQARNGQLMRPDGKLWIVPLAGGESRPLESNLPLMNSWHSFSPNGRWLVFSSKSNTPYTQMFLTHLDDDGHASPPVLIENSTAANRAVNLPEFVNVAYDEFRSIAVPAVDHYRAFARGNELARQGRQAEAVAEFEAALAGEDSDWRLNDWRIHDSLSKVLMQLGQTDRAMEHIDRSLRLNAFNAELQVNAALLHFGNGKHELALRHMATAIRLAPEDAQVWYNRASMRLQLDDAAGALEDYGRAIELNPRYAAALIGRGILLRMTGRLAEARQDLDRAIQLNPNNPTALFFRARVRAESDDVEGALQDLRRTLEVSPPDWAHRSEVLALGAALEQGQSPVD